jgi:hypothetical protein
MPRRVVKSVKNIRGKAPVVETSILHNIKAGDTLMNLPGEQEEKEFSPGYLKKTGLHGYINLQAPGKVITGITSFCSLARAARVEWKMTRLRTGRMLNGLRTGTMVTGRSGLKNTGDDPVPNYELFFKHKLSEY